MKLSIAFKTLNISNFIKLSKALQKLNLMEKKKNRDLVKIWMLNQQMNQKQQNKWTCYSLSLSTNNKQIWITKLKAQANK